MGQFVVVVHIMLVAVTVPYRNLRCETSPCGYQQREIQFAAGILNRSRSRICSALSNRKAS